MKKINLKKLSIVVSAFNEGPNIKNVLVILQKLPYEVIVVDDGSTDATYEIASKLKVKSRKLKVLRHKINLGKGAAMKTGVKYAFSEGVDAVIFMDADGQHKASDLQKFVKALEGGYEIVFGSRNMTYGVPLVRFLGNKLGSIFVNLLFGIYVSDIGCGFRGITKDAYKKIKWDSSGYAVETEMVVRTAKEKLKYCEVPVETLYFDKYKGMTIIDAFSIFLDVIRLKITL